MPRYEKEGEFWAITHDAKQLVIVTGTIGSAGSGAKTSVRKFVSVEHAGAQFVKLTAEKQQTGWTYIERPSATTSDSDDEDREPALEAAIDADPYDESAYSVYADWLQNRGAARGELIALQLAEENDPDNQRLRAATRTYLQANRRVFTHGLDDHLAIQGPNGPACVWRFGFLHRIELDRDADDDLDAAKLLAAVLRHPSGRFVTEISYRELRRGMATAVKMIAKHKRPTLRALAVMARDGMPSLAGVMTAPLRHLVVKGRSGDLGRDCMISLARVPATLERLELRVGETDAYGELAPLFRRTDLAQLKHLALRGCAFADEAVAAIATSAFARQLEHLDLALSPLREVSLGRLADRSVFPSLRRVEISRDRVPPRAIAALAEREVKVGDIRRDTDDCREDWGDDRYEEVRE